MLKWASATAWVRPVKVIEPLMPLPAPFSSEWMVRPSKPVAPSEAVKGSVLVPGWKPKIVAWSPEWKLTMVLHVSTLPRPSTKNVSWLPAPVPPTRKLEPPPPSSTLIPLETASASPPAPPLRNTFGVVAAIATASELFQMY